MAPETTGGGRERAAETGVHTNGRRGWSHNRNYLLTSELLIS